MYSDDIEPTRNLRVPKGLKAKKNTIRITNNPSRIDENQMLTVRFPNLGSNDLIVPGTAKLTFDVVLTSTDKNRTLVKNIGRAIVKKFVVKFDGNELLSIDDYDVLYCYIDLWMNSNEKQDHNAIFQGIVSSKGQTTNYKLQTTTKNRIDSDDKVANAKEETLV